MSKRTKTPSKLTYLDKSYLDNLPPTPLVSNPFGKYTAQQSTTDQMSNTNGSGMEHILLSVIYVESKYLAIVRACLGDTLIISNQESSSVDIQGHGYRDISLGSLRSGTEM